MSRILIGRKRITILSLVCLIVLTLLLLELWLTAGVFIFLIISSFWINRYICRCISNQVPNLYVYRERNLDYMIIGEPCNESKIVPDIENKKGLIFTSATRTLFSSVLIFKRMFSYLRLGGTVYFVGGSKFYKSRNIAHTEIPFLHLVTINLLNLERKKKMSKLPLLFFPFSSIKFLFLKNGSKNIVYSDKITDPNILEFCKERGLNVFYKELI